MKECPCCGYKNSNNALSCDICQANLTFVKPRQEEKFHKTNFTGLMQILAGIFLICAASYVLYPDKFLKNKDDFIKVADITKSGYDVSSVISSLERLSNLKFIGQEEKKAVLSLANSKHPRVRVASVKLLGKWVMNQEEESVEFMKKLIESMEDPNPDVRAESARQIGLILLTKKSVSGLFENIKGKISILLKDANESVRINAIFLAAMMKDKSWLDEFRRLSKYDISNNIKLQALCSLAYFGDSKALASVLKACSNTNTEIRKKAVFCLAYINAKDSERFLKTVINNDPDKNVRDFAKISLNLRKQLAIINNKAKF